MATAVTMSPSSCDAMKPNNELNSVPANPPMPRNNIQREKPVLNAFPIRGKRLHRKRRHSTSEEFPGNPANKPQTAKHRKQGYYHKKEVGDIILPTNFLLGGNIRDPLNLNSMLDEKVNRALNAVTPSSSPLPPRSSTINIVIPNDMTDPLGLNSSNTPTEQSPVEKSPSPIPERERSKSKKRKRRKKSVAERLLPPEPELEHKCSEENEINSNKMINSRPISMNWNCKVPRLKKSKVTLDLNNEVVKPSLNKNALSVTVPQTSGVIDPIVSPVIPQKTNRNALFSPKSRKRKAQTVQTNSKSADPNHEEQLSRLLITDEGENDRKTDESPRKSTKNTNSENKGTRSTQPHKSHQKTINPKNALPVFKQKNSRFQYGNYSQYYGYRNPKKFEDCRLDYLKREWFKEKDVLDVGCNVGHLTLLIARDYSPRKIVGVDIDATLISIARTNIRHYATAGVRPPSPLASSYPESMAKMFGPIVAPPVETGTDDSARFPNNILFFEGNYVPEVDEIIRFQEPEYDVIMCMSVTKWMHMNWGDAGIKKTFERFFKQLRAGGKLILEPQDWKSYGKKKKLTERIYNHYHAIELLPSMFPDYLINVVGFESVEYLTSTVPNTPVGFKRPIQLYRKPE